MLVTMHNVTNKTEVTNPNVTLNTTYTLDPATCTLWIFGIAVSVFCLLVQLTFFTVMSKCRKFNEKTLTQLTLARLVNTIIEFAMVMGKETLQSEVGPRQLKGGHTVLRLLYLQSDMALLCWMFLFTKNMYDKIVIVTLVDKRNFLCYMLSMFTITLLLAIVYVSIPFVWDLFKIQKEESSYNETMYEIYVIPKFIVLLVNLLYFCKIFAVAQKANRNHRNLKVILKTCAVSFIFFLVSSLQVLVADFLHYLKMNTFENWCYVLSSYQIVAITAIFMISVKGRVPEGALWRTFCKGARDTMEKFNFFLYE